MGPSSFQWCPATGQGAMGTNWSLRSSVWTWGRTFSLWGWQGIGTGCPERLWIFLLWRYSRPAWTRSCSACCRWPSFGRGVGLDDPYRSLPTPNILWFCERPVSSSLEKHREAHWQAGLIKMNKHLVQNPPRAVTWEPSAPLSSYETHQDRSWRATLWNIFLRQGSQGARHIKGCSEREVYDCTELVTKCLWEEKNRKREEFRWFGDEQGKENEKLRGKKGQLNVNIFLISMLLWLLGPRKLATGETGI